MGPAETSQVELAAPGADWMWRVRGVAKVIRPFHFGWLGGDGADGGAAG